MTENDPNEVPRGIVWLASYPKSGNTWTRAFLHNLLQLMRGSGRSAQDINSMNEFTTWDLSSERYEKIIGKHPMEAEQSEIAEARLKVQEQIADDCEGLSFVKTHNALVMDRGFPTINFAATSGAIYIVRNPLDVAVSYSHHMSKTLDDTIDAMGSDNVETPVTEKSVYEVYGSWSQHVHSWTRNDHRAIYIMRYEDMKADPRKTFGALASHLLLRPTDEQLDAAIEMSSFEKLQEQEKKEGFREKPKKAKRFFREGRTDQWREVLSPQQFRRIVDDHREQMERFGYWPIDYEAKQAGT
ncbi:sulfotransferase domain-containing protein [Nitratireductor sp. XY-223]|uniref:sulfotransferase domain-containing protein n=1 Tax=Nitratireductor sp. XY-223 TaxID=2561926 RepID=UPI00145BCF35|nr:sulfotransferase domain-containing protein [Nitratireductor sp. XY-223]